MPNERIVGVSLPPISTFFFLRSFFPFLPHLLFFSWHSPTRGFGNWWVYVVAGHKKGKRRRWRDLSLFFKGFLRHQKKRREKNAIDEFPNSSCSGGGGGGNSLRFSSFARAQNRNFRRFSSSEKTFVLKNASEKKVFLTRSRSRQSVISQYIFFLPKCQIFFYNPLFAASLSPIFSAVNSKKNENEPTCSSFENAVGRREEEKIPPLPQKPSSSPP